MSKHNLWVECVEHKKSVGFLNNELLKHQEHKGQNNENATRSICELVIFVRDQFISKYIHFGENFLV